MVVAILVLLVGVVDGVIKAEEVVEETGLIIVMVSAAAMIFQCDQ